MIVNNQVGFHNGSKKDARSSLYATDVAKANSSPDLPRGNGDDPEAVVKVAQLAFRVPTGIQERRFVIDIVCYPPTLVTNEGDDPSMTQPMMYKPN